MRKQFPSGMSLIDLLTAFFVIAIGAAVVTGFLINGYTSLALSTERLQANGYAANIIEGMRGIAMSNLLRYGEPTLKKPDCWKLFPDAADCSGKKITEGSSYTLNLSIDPWKLEPASPLVDEATGEPTIKNMETSILEQYKIDKHENVTTPFFHFVQVVYPESGVMQVTAFIQWERKSEVKTVKLSGMIGAVTSAVISPP